MRDIAQEHNGTRTQSLSTRRKIISSVRPRHIIKRRWRSCTQTGVKHKPLRIGRTCARMGEISSASVDSQSDVFVRKERVWRKHYRPNRTRRVRPSTLPPLRGIAGLPAAESKEGRLRSCTQIAVKHKPLRIGRTCARMREISSASVDSQSDVFVRKERVWRKH